jgi:ribonuclease D
VLFALASQRPRDKAGLARVKGMPRGLLERRWDQLLEAIRRGEAVPDDQLPRRPERVRVRWPRGTPQRIARLKAWRLKASERVKLEPGVLLPQRLIDALAADPPVDAAGLEVFPGLRRWRAREFGAELLVALQG